MSQYKVNGKAREGSLGYIKYPSYKDSGVEWLGEIPENWIVKKLKYALVLQSKKVVINSQNVIALENIDSWTGRYIATESKYQGEEVEFQANDILFGKLRPYLAKVFQCKAKGVAFGDLLTYSPKKSTSSTYAFYSLVSEPFIKIVDSSTYGAKMPRASVDFINEMLIFLPSFQEQKTIANYLDKATTKIDTLIEKQTQLIALLKEKRQAVISSAVTRGLDASVPMKDSGVEWLGEIPEGWVGRKFKYSARIQGGKDQKEVLDDNGDYPVYGSGGIFGQAREYLYNGESVLLGRKGTVDKPLYVTGKFWTVDTMYFTKIEALVSVRWFFYSCLTIHFDYYQYGSAVPSMTQEDLHNIKFSTPSLKEQEEIANYLDRTTSKIDTLTEKQTQLIALLKEKRTALISAAVTGKIDVRDAA